MQSRLQSRVHTTSAGGHRPGISEFSTFPDEVQDSNRMGDLCTQIPEYFEAPSKREKPTVQLISLRINDGLLLTGERVWVPKGDDCYLQLNEWENAKYSRGTFKLTPKPIPKAFDSHKRIRKVYSSVITQLRTGKISLPSYSHFINQADEPECSCGWGRITVREVISSPDKSVGPQTP